MEFVQPVDGEHKELRLRGAFLSESKAYVQELVWQAMDTIDELMYDQRRQVAGGEKQGTLQGHNGLLAYT